MLELSMFAPVELSDSEKRSLEKQMADAFALFEKASIKEYGFANVKKLRNDYKKGQIKLDDETRSAMDGIIAIEQRIVSGYIKMSIDLCVKFRERYGITSSDYLQEAAMAIYDAIYMYNGKTRFSTYSFWCMKNRMLDFHRDEKENITFNDAVKKVSCETGSRTCSKHRKSSRNLTNVLANNFLTDLAAEEVRADAVTLQHALKFSFDMNETTEVNSRIGELLDIVHESPLSEMERLLVNAALRGDDSFRAKVSETVVNPNTGKFWTKQRLSQLYIRACEKIRVHYQKKCRAAA